MRNCFVRNMERVDYMRFDRSENLSEPDFDKVKVLIASLEEFTESMNQNAFFSPFFFRTGGGGA